MMTDLLILFIVLNVVNVILQTVKSIATVKCGKVVASAVNAISYFLYTFVLIYTNCELNIWLKASIVAIANFVGVFTVKYFEEKMRKSRLWKVEATLTKEQWETEKEIFVNMKVPHNYIDIDKYVILNFYCATQKESLIVRNFIEMSGAKCFVSESKNLY